tara:strand:+ start:3554 stop:4180 length:627 start_codon:yes stop_codon:yes gene_type:complete
MFEKLTQYIMETEPTILNSSTPEYEPLDYKVIVLEDVLTDEEIAYCKLSFESPEVEKHEIYAHPPETHKIFRERADFFDIHEISLELQKTVEPIKEKFDLSGLGMPNTSMWRDTEGFNLFPHCDQKVLNVTMQIYLDDDCDKECGTTFIKPVFGSEHGEELLTTLYGKGNGYILLNTNKEMHGMMKTVPADNIRTSLYIVFDKNEVIN